MGLLAPLFLLGLGALAVPVIVHLVQRDRRLVVEFPSLMFLRRIPFQATRRHKLRRLLLLALRCLALAVIAAAFARPVLREQRARALLSNAAGGREVVILLDQSYSMSYRGRWERARDAARDMVAGMRGGDRATLVTFGRDARVLVPATASGPRLASAIDALAPSGEATRYAPALRLAAQVLASSDRGTREIVIITDFQRVAWSRFEEIALPRGARLSFRDVSRGETADVGVTTVTAERRGDGDTTTAIVQARLANRGPTAASVNVALEVGGRAAQDRRAAIPPGGTVTVAFAPVRVARGAVRGTVSVTGDALPANDRRHFVVAPGQAVRALLVQPAGARDRLSFYVVRALTLADAPKVMLTVRTAGAISDDDIAGNTLYLFNEAALPRGVVGARIRDRISQGAGAIFVAGEREADVPLEWRAFMPAGVGRASDLGNRVRGGLSFIERSHPVFERLAGARAGEFAEARVLRRRVLTPHDSASILARFDDGSPALVEMQVGRGRVLAWGTTLDDAWTDLPLQPAYLPFMHRLATHAGRARDDETSLTVGDAFDVAGIAELLGTTDVVVESPSHALTRLSPSRGTSVLTLAEPGFHEVRSPSVAVGSGHPVPVNVDPAEADLSHFEPAELSAAVTATGATPDVSGAPLATGDEEYERRQRIWWYLLLAALIVLAAETAMSNRVPVSRSGGTG